VSGHDDRVKEPRATYRVQLHGGFGFDQAAELAGYLSALGISHLYSSPYLQAARGSTHGYDVVDHTRVNVELGGQEAHQRFCLALGRARLGQLLDIVPNHMAITPENQWWWDVLENGPSSPYAAYFDVEWDPPESRMRNVVLLPVLGDHYGRVLDAGELAVERHGGTFVVRYHDHLWPASPRSMDGLLARAATAAGSDELAFFADSLGSLPLSSDPRAARRRHRDKEVVRRLLARLVKENPAVAAAIDVEVDRLNRDPDALDAVIQRQNFRPAFWRTASHELGYRRFFDINSLVGLRTEDEKVFADTHALVLRWLRDGVLDGVRIDHPDGLRDPEGYFRRLRDHAPAAWVVAEKILEPGERLPETWPIAGTTGYDFLNRVGGLFVDPRGEEPLTRFYADFTGEKSDYAALVRDKKLQVLRDVLGSDVNRLTAVLQDVCERHRRHRDYTRNELHHALRELVACFPVYRTYVRAPDGSLTAQDERYIGEAVAAAKAGRGDLDAELFDFLGRLLRLEIRGDLEAELVMRFQQLTGPAMAKGVEDTTFYNFNRLVALNEVGGDPGRFGVSLEAFHEACAEAWARWPRALLATSTHDSKRSEDVRARLGLLSEIPERWAEAVRGWATINEDRRGSVDRNTEYLFYQTLVGAWPLSAERAAAYMEKAAREAKARTSWTRPDAAYEEALGGFVRDCLEDVEFRRDVAAFVGPLIEPGRITSLAQTLVKITAPGVPDFYQGTELWDLSLVDPDNRRPVDYERRRRLLSEAEGLSAEDALARMDEGLPKLWLIRHALCARRSHARAFGEGEPARYRGLSATGSRANHVAAFERGGEVVTVVPRLVLTLAGEWEDTRLTLPPGRWRNDLTGQPFEGDVALGELLARFPLALLLLDREP
jgi:(1->4)-alpha-D-glucan 1-alpha-D-glucosylmutase